MIYNDRIGKFQTKTNTWKNYSEYALISTEAFFSEVDFKKGEKCLNDLFNSLNIYKTKIYIQ